MLLDVFTEEGVTGRSYLFGYIPAALVPMVKLVEQLAADLKGKPVVPLERMRAFDLRFRLLGMQGLVGMVVSGLDMAFWDILGKAADMPVARLRPGSPGSCPSTGIGGRPDPDWRKLVVSTRYAARHHRQCQ